ncbi:MAG: hypothetical protein ACOYYU_08340 [Chloroflexota bacterium]
MSKNNFEIETLLRAWESGSRDSGFLSGTDYPANQISIVEALGEIGDTQAIKPLVKFLRERPHHIEIEYIWPPVERMIADSLHKIMIRHKENIATPFLLDIASLKDMVVSYWPFREGEGELDYRFGKEQSELSFSKIRQLAQEELNRRDTTI